MRNFKYSSSTRRKRLMERPCKHKSQVRSAKTGYCVNVKKCPAGKKLNHATNRCKYLPTKVIAEQLQTCLEKHTSSTKSRSKSLSSLDKRILAALSSSKNRKSRRRRRRS